MMRSSLSSSKEFDFQRNTQRFENWARIYGCTPDFFHQPTSIEEIREIINYAKDHDQKIRLIGAAHSPSDVRPG
jgi:FAD/FMN-containing dehydrogenase